MSVELSRGTSNANWHSLRIQQQHPHPQAGVAVGPCVVFEEIGCTVQPKKMNAMCIPYQSFLIHQYVFACGFQFQGRDHSGIVKSRLFGMGSTRSSRWLKRVLDLSTSRPYCRLYTGYPVQRREVGTSVLSWLAQSQPQRVGSC